MAQAYFNRIWQSAMEELSEVLEIENPAPILDASGKPIPDKTMVWNDVVHRYTVLYLKYLQIGRKLEDCYDQIVHPQKRRDIRVSLDCVLARISQLRELVTTFSPGALQTDFRHLENYLLANKLTMADIEVPIPRYFKEYRPTTAEEQEVRAVVAKYLEDRAMAGASFDEEGEAVPVFRMTKERAIAVLQRNERGRQARHYVATRLLKMPRGGLGLGMSSSSSSSEFDLDVTKATVICQAVARGARVRRRLANQVAEEEVLIGMRPPPPAGESKRYDPIAKDAEVRLIRKARQTDHELKYTEALVELEQQVTNAVGPELKDKMWNERYEWWLNEVKVTGKAPKNLDGYYKMLAEKDKKPENPESAAAAEEERKKQEEEERRRARNSSNAKGKSGKGPDETETALHSVPPSDVIGPLMETLVRYKEVWADSSEANNPDQLHDEALARKMLLPEISERVKVEVDAQLAVFLANIQAKAAVKASTKKKKKGSGEKKKKAKKEKRKKSGKTKKYIEGEKASIGMTISDMVTRLVDLNIIQASINQRPLSDFIGEINLLGSQYLASGVSVDPSMAQIRQLLTATCILPLGSPYVKAHAPRLTSLLLYGPRGTGKTALAKAIAYETGALWMDLSPSIIESHLGNKAEVGKLMYQVFRVAKAIQPCVIYIDESEKLFPKGKAIGPLVRMRKSLAIQRDNLASTDRVLIVGNSRVPFHPKTDFSSFTAFFSRQSLGKMIFCPCPDHATRLLLWRKFIEASGIPSSQLSQNTHFDLSTLAFVTEGYPAGSILQAVRCILTPRRVQSMERGDFIKADEFIDGLSKTTYMYQEEYRAFVDFMEATEPFSIYKAAVAIAQLNKEATKPGKGNQPAKKKQ